MASDPVGTTSRRETKTLVVPIVALRGGGGRVNPTVVVTLTGVAPHASVTRSFTIVQEVKTLRRVAADAEANAVANANKVFVAPTEAGTRIGTDFANPTDADDISALITQTLDLTENRVVYFKKGTYPLKIPVFIRGTGTLRLIGGFAGDEMAGGSLLGRSTAYTAARDSRNKNKIHTDNSTVFDYSNATASLFTITGDVDLIIEGITFTRSHEAAINSDGGIIDYRLTSSAGRGVSVYDCIFDSVEVGTGKDGGAIYAGDYTQLYIDRCIFKNNTAGKNGGAISLKASNVAKSGFTIIANSLFYGNGAEASTSEGGAIRVEKYDLEVYQSTFANNHANSAGGIMVK